MASSTNAASQSSVQPSSTLIDALHQKLCDPSIVAEFERCRSPHVTQRLISPRWILTSIADDETDYEKSADNISIKENAEKAIDTNHHHDNTQEEPNNNNHEPSKFNTVPKRSYLDIRMEQNTIFANDQCLRCQKKLAALSSTSPKSVEAINVNRTQIQKVIDSIRNHLKEGLSACPNHEGLVQVESEVQVWLNRLNGVAAVDRVHNTAAVTKLAGAKESRGNNETIIDLTKPDTQQQTVMKRKGGDGRAQAAMDDALVEKMFLQGDQQNGCDPNNKDDAVDTNRSDLKWVPPAPRGDESADQHMRREEYPSDSDSHYDRKRRRHHGRRRNRYRSRSRSRSRSVERREEQRKGERRRHRHDDRKRKKHRHRSRSRSMSRGSLSPTATLPSRSTSRDRSKRRHRSNRHKHKRRHKSKSHRKERRKSSKRHRSRREHSQSASPSSLPSVPGDDDFNGRFEPPRLSQSGQLEIGGEQPAQRKGVEGGSAPQLNENETSLEITDRSAIEKMEIEASHTYS